MKYIILIIATLFHTISFCQEEIFSCSYETVTNGKIKNGKEKWDKKTSSYGETEFVIIENKGKYEVQLHRLDRNDIIRFEVSEPYAEAGSYFLFGDNGYTYFEVNDQTGYVNLYFSDDWLWESNEVFQTFDGEGYKATCKIKEGNIERI